MILLNNDLYDDDDNDDNDDDDDDKRTSQTVLAFIVCRSMSCISSRISCAC